MASFRLTEISQQILVGVVVFVAVRLLMTWRRLANVGGSHPETRRPPCLPWLPVVGSQPFMKTTILTLHEYMVDKSRQLGCSVIGAYFGSSYTVILNGADVIREAVVKNSTQFADRAVSYLEKASVNTRRRGVLNATYNAAFRRKHQLYLAIMKQFGFGQRLMETRINVEVKELIHQIRLTGGQPFDPREMITSAVLNVIGSIIIGRRYQLDDPKLAQIKGFVRDWINKFVPEINLFPLLRFVPKYRKRMNYWTSRLEDFLKFLNQEIEDILAEDPSCRQDSFIRRFLEAAEQQNSSENGELSREELTFVVRDLYGAGTETVTATLRWALVLLANHRDVQTRLQLEVDSVIGSDRLPSLDDEPSMTYTQAVVMETMRRHTMVPRSLPRTTLSDARLDGDIYIPAGATVMCNLYSVHMDPVQFPEPTVFKPERFLNDEGAVINREQIMPFSLGKRSCLGELLARQELFLFLAGLVQNFDICPPKGQHTIECSEVILATNEPTPFDVRLVPRITIVGEH